MNSVPVSVPQRQPCTFSLVDGLIVPFAANQWIRSLSPLARITDMITIPSSRRISMPLSSALTGCSGLPQIRLVHPTLIIRETSCQCVDTAFTRCRRFRQERMLFNLQRVLPGTVSCGCVLDTRNLTPYMFSVSRSPSLDMKPSFVAKYWVPILTLLGSASAVPSTLDTARS